MLEETLVDKNEILYRGIAHHQIKFDVKANKIRPSSAAFKKRSSEEGLSVDIASKTTPERSLDRLRLSVALAKLEAYIPIDLGYKVVEDPVENNDAHALIRGKITRSHSRQIAAKCSWQIPPDSKNIF